VAHRLFDEKSIGNSYGQKLIEKSWIIIHEFSMAISWKVSHDISMKNPWGIHMGKNSWKTHELLFMTFPRDISVRGPSR